MVVCGGALAAISGLAQDGGRTPVDLAGLKASFEGALAKLDERYVQLDQSYLQALARLLEAETQAANLEAAVMVKKEAEAFTASAGKFKEAVFRRNLSKYEPLNRLQTKYLEARSALTRELERPKSELVRRYDQELDKLQVGLTQAGNLPEALAVREERQRLIDAPPFGQPPPASFSGKAKFVTKGEVEVFINGDPLSYRDLYEGREEDLRVTAESRPEDFKVGDILVVRSRSRTTFRGVIIALEALDGSVYVPIRLTHLSRLRDEANPKQVTTEMIASAKSEPTKGATDGEMLAAWASFGLPAADKGGSEWFQPDQANVWNTWATVITDEMILPWKVPAEK